MTPENIDVVCMGRASVDLYSEQIGSRLEDVQYFRKYLGGSSANMCVGMSRQGLRTAMLTRVGNEQLGRFLVEEFERNGVNTSFVVVDDDRLTALAILGIRDRDTFPLLFYRSDCADMAVCQDDVDKSLIAAAASLAITGTHFSTSGTRSACALALKYARLHSTRCVLDIDYRPVLWNVADIEDGESRFIAAESVTKIYQEYVQYFDLIVGTEEEFHIAGGSTNLYEALANLRRLTNAHFVVKLGPDGCAIVRDEVPKNKATLTMVGGTPVEVFNVLGAGDAFMSGLMRGWIAGLPLEECAKFANGCGALVVSRHGCAPAIPTAEELDAYLNGRVDEVEHLHWATTRKRHWPELRILAFDHRKQFVDMAEKADKDLAAIEKAKHLIMAAFLRARESCKKPEACGVLVDDRFGANVLAEMTGTGAWIGRPVEEPGSRPLQFEVANNLGLNIMQWPEEHVAKCLVFVDVNDSDEHVRLQTERVLELQSACRQTNHELLLELIPVDKADKGILIQSIDHFYAAGVKPDWWKLPAQSEQGWNSIDLRIELHDPHCRGVVLLGLDAPLDSVLESFANSANSKYCRGFAVGRTVFGESVQSWLNDSITDDELVETVANRYTQLIDGWERRRLDA